MRKVFFHNADRTLIFHNKKKLKQFIEIIFQKESKPLQRLDYIFCSDEYLRQLNTTFLNHDYYTDILTFDLSSVNSDIHGEIYISIDRVIDNSSKHATTTKKELLRVIFHGALHLCGYKDKEKNEWLLMRQKEDEYLSLYK